MDEIRSIERRRERTEFKFFVTIGSGEAILLTEVSAGELQTYAAFQKALLARYGVYFRNDDYEASRGRGAAAWRDEIEWQLGRKASQPTAITEDATA